jgi:8-oxo-dGTP pyrophosphatase MutT (NUDIX family)/phosphohistidine phosphatase SixA
VASNSPVLAAGCVVWRHGDSEPEILLIHRPRWSDWSFPKGKLDPGETQIAAAIREVQEETGLGVRLGPRLPDQHYEAAGGQAKVVAYWAAQPANGSDLTAYERNDEIDDLRWAPLSAAREQLTYRRDKRLLDSFESSGYDGEPLLVVRHAEAVKRKAWDGPDTKRPLTGDGAQQAARLVELLTAYGVSLVLSSDATRCVDTVLPYVEASGVELELDPVLSEEASKPRLVRKRVASVLPRDQPIALCTHRPLLASVLEAAGTEVVGLMPAETLVLHRRAGRVVDLEQHPS